MIHIHIRAKLPCLQLIQERFWNAIKDEEEYTKNKYPPEFEFCMFWQAWDGVFFGERLAYKILNPHPIFYEDIGDGQMASVSKRGKYVRKE